MLLINSAKKVGAAPTSQDTWQIDGIYLQDNVEQHSHRFSLRLQPDPPSSCLSFASTKAIGRGGKVAGNDTDLYVYVRMQKATEAGWESW